MNTPITSFSGEFEFLSNFYPVDIIHEGLVYPSVEHAYQAMKTFVPSERNRIRLAKTPGKAKRLGAKVVLWDTWDMYKEEIMMHFCYDKFDRAKNPDLVKRLLQTESRTIIEGNTWGDTYWGVCKGEGLNKLGEILMDIRHYHQFNYGGVV